MSATKANLLRRSPRRAQPGISPMCLFRKVGQINCLLFLSGESNEAQSSKFIGWRLCFAAALFATLLPIASMTAMAAEERVRSIAEITSPGGIRAWLVEERAIPLVAMRFAFTGGALQDPEGKEGLTAIMASLLSEGAGEHSAEAFSRRLADQAARFSISGGRDWISGGLDVLSNRFAAASDLLRLALSEPSFEAASIARVRAQHLSGLSIAANEPRAVALERFHAEAFPDHVLGRPVNGTPASVARITDGDIKAHHSRLLARDNLHVVFVGDIDQETATAALDRIFGALPARATLRPYPKIEPRVVPQPVVVDRVLPAATAVFALPSLEQSDPDYPALQVLSHILASGDFDSRLTEEIRVKRGLAYSVQARLTSEGLVPLLLGGLTTRNETMGEALGVLRELLGDTARDGPTPEAFANAKLYLVGAYLLDFDTNAGMASQLLRVMLAGHGVSYVADRNSTIEQVTLADVRRVAGRVLRTDRLIVTIVGKPTLDR